MTVMADRQQRASSPTKHLEEPHTEPKKSQQTNKTINQTRAWQQHDNPYNLEQSETFMKK
jgi:hypothetical protein